MEKQATTIWQFPKISSIRQREGFYCRGSMSHPAKMPTYLAQAMILTYTKPGDLILDPMAGIGTTVIEAVKLGRNAIGVEYEEKFVRLCNKSLSLTKQRLGTQGSHALFIKGDSRELSKLLQAHHSISSIIFSPPYGHESYKSVTSNSKLGDEIFGYAVPYSEQKGNCKDPSEINIGLQRGRKYLEEMLKVYEECYKVLKLNGFMILVVKNIRKNGEEINLMSDTIQLCKLAGFKFFQTCIHVLNSASFWQINHTKRTPYLMLNLTEYVLVFKKPCNGNQLTGKGVVINEKAEIQSKAGSSEKKA